jgi:hypothetical protein
MCRRIPNEFDVTAKAPAVEKVNRAVAHDLVGDIRIPHSDVSGLWTLHLGDSLV